MTNVESSRSIGLRTHDVPSHGVDPHFTTAEPVPLMLGSRPLGTMGTEFEHDKWTCAEQYLSTLGCKMFTYFCLHSYILVGYDGRQITITLCSPLFILADNLIDTFS